MPHTPEDLRKRMDAFREDAKAQIEIAEGHARMHYEERLLKLLLRWEARGAPLEHKSKALKTILACNRGDQHCDACPIMSCSDNTSKHAVTLRGVLGRAQMLEE